MSVTPIPLIPQIPKIQNQKQSQFDAAHGISNEAGY